MIKAAVLGSPINHSLSPFIHNRAYEILGVEGNYERHEVTAESFDSFIELARNSDWTGFSLTMPLKEAPLKAGFDVDSRAQTIQSVNTLVRTGDSFRALSTDVLAFDRILQNISYHRVAIIGGGGTARAALGALDGTVDQVTMLQRGSNRNSQLVAAVSQSEIVFADLSTPLSDFDLVISATPAGASDSLASSIAGHAGTLIESLYKPWPTVLASAWEQRGGHVIHGLDLLVEQALDQIHLFANTGFDYTSMRSQLLAEVTKQIQ